MAIRGVSLAEKEEYILPYDHGNPEHEAYKKAIENDETPEKPTIFYLGNLTKAQRVYIGDMVGGATMKDSGIRMEQKRTERNYTLVQFGLSGWANMQDYQGKQVAFKVGTGQFPGLGFQQIVDDDCFAHLSVTDIGHLAEKILEKNGMGPQGLGGLEGNSVPPSLPSDETNFEGGGAASASKTASKKKGVVKT